MATDEEDQAPHGRSTFAERLNTLFETHRSPNGDQYSLTEVRDATKGKLTIAYLSLLRKGGIKNPSIDKVQLIADFFGVSTTYFTDDGVASTTDRELSEALRRALAEPKVRQLALRASELGPEEHDLYLRLLDYSKEIAARIAVERTVRIADADRADRGSGSTEDT